MPTLMAGRTPRKKVRVQVDLPSVIEIRSSECSRDIASSVSITAGR
jgi:hypothetical protein